jgi:hypothetical protein
VRTALGLPGNSETARSKTERPCCTTRRVEWADRPQRAMREAGEPAGTPVDDMGVVRLGVHW